MSTTGGKKRLRYLNALVAVLVAVIVVLLGAVLVNQGGASGKKVADQTRSQQPSPLDSLARRNPGDPLALGNPNAPVVMVAYSDFRCPFCAKYANDIAPKLVERYVDTGVLRVEWRDFPIFGPDSMRAAKAGRAAAQQGKFWAFHDAVYSQAPPSGHPAMPVSRLVEFAKQAGVPDIERFKADMNDPAAYEAIRTDATQAAQLGVSATPTFVVNGDPIMGAQPLQAFVRSIEQARKEAA